MAGTLLFEQDPDFLARTISACWRLLGPLEYMARWTMAAKRQQTKLLTASELDDALSNIYYAPGGFQGIAALHSRLPKGSASKEKVRGWLSSQDVGRSLLISRRIDPTQSTKPTFSSSHMTGWAARLTNTP